jgi:hypothetical protein
MKERSRNSVMGLAMLSALALAGAIFLTPAPGVRAEKPDGPDKSDSNGRRLEGTWRVQVTIRNCQSGAELKKFPALLTFAQGGTLTETTTAFPPAQRTPGHGYWQHARARTYTAVSEAFLFNAANAWTGKQRLTQAIEFGGDPDEFNSTATNEIFDINGNLLVTGCATAVASRLE